MKYGVIPTSVLERLALWSGRMPVPVIDALFSIMKARTIMAGVRLGVFEALRDGPLSPEEVAERCGLDVECTELLLRTLVYAEYLKKKGDRYTLSKLSRRSLVSGAKRELFGYIQWNYTQWEMLGRLEELIRTGLGIDFHETMTDEAAWGHYQRAMLELARIDAPAIARRVPVRRGARQLLDIAGSHGLIGAAICRKHPPMKSEVLELPSAVEHARRLARDEKIADIVTHRAGDLRADEYGDHNDVVLLSNILHHFGPDVILDILDRARRSLNPNGTLAIWEVEIPDKGRKPSEGDGGALFFRLTSNARCHSSSEYAGWLRQAGFERVRAHRPKLSPGNVLVIGRTA